MFGLFKPTTCTTAAPSTPARTVERHASTPHVEVSETDESVLLAADMPGISLENVEVRVHGDVLSLYGSSKNQEPDGVTALWREYTARDYACSFRLGTAIEAERISATAKDGVVRVTLPKRTAVRPRQISVTSG